MITKAYHFMRLLLYTCLISISATESITSLPSLGIPSSPTLKFPKWPRFYQLRQLNGVLSNSKKIKKNHAHKRQLNSALSRSKSSTLDRFSVHNHNPIGRAIYFWARAGPIVAHYKFAQWRLRNASREQRDMVYERLHNTYCHPTLAICLHLQGLFIKVGQVLSARPDFVPHPYVELLSTVQDSVPQWPFEQIRELVSDSLRIHQGLEWEDVFERMDEIALGSASIGQCHRAKLKPSIFQSTSVDSCTTTGSQTRKPQQQQHLYQDVAVKVMHPNAKVRFHHDFQIFAWLCRIALPGWKPILEELRKQMMTEFDYRQEAHNLEEVRTNMLASPYRNDICIPEPIHELCSSNLLVMELLEGKKFGDAMEERLGHAIGSQSAAKDFLRQKKMELVLGTAPAIDGEGIRSNSMTFLLELLKKNREEKTSFWNQCVKACRLVLLHRYIQRRVCLLLDVHGYQIFLNRVFNGDCHPGNILELSNGKIGLIDYGQTKRLSHDESLAIAKVVVALGQDWVDTAKVAAAMRECGFVTKFNKDEVLAQYAKLFFDSDDEAKAQGCATPQMYLLKLTSLDPLIHVPDDAIFTARASYLFRGMGSMAGEPIHTSKYWRKHAEEALQTAALRDAFNNKFDNFLSQVGSYYSC